MSEELFAIVPVAHRRIEVEHRILADPQPPAHKHTLEHLQAVDAAFAGNKEQADAAMGLIGLSLSAPWLLDFLRDQFCSRVEEEDDPPRPRPRACDDER
jgi:hypothetical protein